MQTCDRCRQETLVTTMSFFNTDTICPECKTKERNHPKFGEALKAENEACRTGNYNFPGIGKPSDL